VEAVGKARPRRAKAAGPAPAPGHQLDLDLPAAPGRRGQDGQPPPGA